MMAIFNTPMNLTDHETKAIKTALEIKKNMQEADLGIEIGIGINTGEAVIGNMGSDTRFDYTAIGDAVNLAARLESSTKEVGEDIVIGHSTAINSTMPTIFLDPIKVKGKKDDIIIYTIESL